MNSQFIYTPFSEVFKWCQKSNIGSRQGKSDGKYKLYIASGKDFKYYDEYLEEGESLVFGTGGNPCIHYVTGRFAYTNHCEAAQKKRNDVCTKFYYYYFQKDSFAQLRSTFVGGGIKNSSKKKIGSLLVPVPPLPEQERIVARIEELFSQLDAGVAELQAAKKRLKVYRQAVLKEAFEGKLTECWRKEHPENSLDDYWAEICKKKEECHNAQHYQMKEVMTLPELPDGWKWVCVGDITSGPEYGTSKKSLKVGAVPVIRMGNLQNGEIDWSDLVFTNDIEEIKKYRLKPNTVLFNRTNSPELVGKTAIFRGEREAIFAGYLIRLNQFDCINPEYLNYYMNSLIAKNYGNRVKTDGVNQSNINGKKLCTYPFPLCTRAEQDQVVYELESRLSVCDSIEQTVDTALQQAEALRQSILKQAFEGKL
ncbi:MAG: restriction endonuclease [Clostridiales bacterium]|nr:restriction endonuclease [Clostridiales bacterium]